jgi:hypothetical protein
MLESRWLVVGSLVVLASLGFSRVGESQARLGARGGVFLADGDPFVGGEVLVEVADDLFFNPNVEVAFPNNATRGLFNFDLHYDFARVNRAFFWVGAGLAVIYTDPEGRDSETDAGANVLFGVGFNTSGRWIPYVQAKILAADDSDFGLAFGIRF